MIKFLAQCIIFLEILTQGFASDTTSSQKEGSSILRNRQNETLEVKADVFQQMSEEYVKLEMQREEQRKREKEDENLNDFGIIFLASTLSVWGICIALGI